MTTQMILLLVAYVVAVLVLAVPMGRWLAAVGDGRLRKLQGFDNAVLRLCCASPEREQGWRDYAVALLVFNVLGVVAVYALQRLQGALPLNPQAMAAAAPDSAFNTAVSFVTNTNWQGYSGESTMSYLTQMLVLAVQNYFSAATGMAVAFAFIRGFARHSAQTLGNFWVDVTRITLYARRPVPGVRADGGRQTARLGTADRDDGDLRVRGRRHHVGRAGRQPEDRGPRRGPDRKRVAVGQHGGQGNALRHRRHVAVRGHHHRRVMRCGERHARLVHAARRRGADAADPTRRSGVRRRGLGPVRHAGVRAADRVHRRADDRAHTRIPGQEDRAGRHETRVARHPHHAAGRAGRHCGGGLGRCGQVEHGQPRCAGLRGGAVRLLVGGQQQRQRLRRLVREHAFLQQHVGRGDVVRPLQRDRAGAGAGGLARGEEARAAHESRWRIRRDGRHAYARPALRRAADLDRDAGGRAHLRAGHCARPGGRTRSAS